MRRVVAVSTGTFFDTTGGLEREDAPVMKEPSSDPYTITKMAAFQDAMARAAAGQDVVTTHPGAIFGPSPVASNALGRTSFNRVLLSALRQRIQQYLTFPVSWVFADDIARGCILALDRGVSGERYMLDGRPEDVVSTAEACNRICALAGIDHRVVDVEPSDDPELAKVFGPTLVAIASKAAKDSGAPHLSPSPRPTSGWATTPSVSTTGWLPPRRGCAPSTSSEGPTPEVDRTQRLIRPGPAPSRRRPVDVADDPSARPRRADVTRRRYDCPRHLPRAERHKRAPHRHPGGRPRRQARPNV